MCICVSKSGCIHIKYGCVHWDFIDAWFDVQTPNGNHAGIMVALAKGLYKECGLDLEIVSPHQDAYNVTPASKVTSGIVDLAIGPSETVISHACREEGDPLHDSIVAVGALLQDDDSAIVTTKASGIDSMKKLQGKRYASYAARYEGRIVQSMIKYAGGNGEYIECTPEKLGIWDTILTGNMDATWVFMHWEGEEAKMKGIDLNVFRLKDHGVVYGYPLVLFARRDCPEPQHLAAFLKQTAKGYEYAAMHKEEAAGLAISMCKNLFPDFAFDQEHMRRSVIAASSTFLNQDGKALVMREDTWDGFLEWLYENGLLTTKMQSRRAGEGKTTLDGLRHGDSGDPIPHHAIRAKHLFTNEYLI